MSDGSERNIPRAVFWAAWLTFLALSPGYVNNVDGYVVYHTNRSFVDTGGLALRPTPEQAYAQEMPYVREDDAGRRFPVFGHLFPFMTLPFYLAGHLLAPVLALPARELSTFTFSLANTLFSALAVALWCRIALVVGAGRRSTARLAGWLAFATPILFYAVSQWREPGILVLLSWAVLWFLSFTERPRSRGRALALGSVLGLLFLFKEGNAVLVACLWIGALLAVLVRARRWPVSAAFWLGLPVAASLVLHGAVMAARFGTPFTTFYEPGLQIMEGDPLARLGRILASPDVGLVFYAAPVVAGILAYGAFVRRRPHLAWSLAAASLLFLGLHALIRNGEGGRHVWAPRHLVPLFPAFLLALTLWWEKAGRGARLVVGTVVGVSIVIQLLPIVQPYFLYPGLREDAPTVVADRMPGRLGGSVRVASHLLSGRGPRFSGEEFGVDGDVVWDLADNRVVAGGVNVWWLRSDVPRLAPGIGLALALLAVGAWWRVVRKAREP